MRAEDLEKVLELTEIQKEIHSAVTVMRKLPSGDIRCKDYILDRTECTELGLSIAGNVAGLIALYVQWKAERGEKEPLKTTPKNKTDAKGKN